MRACQHDIFENISENIFEDIFKETLRPRTRIVGRPTTSWHLASCDATSLPYCRSLCELLLLLLQTCSLPLASEGLGKSWRGLT
jgi:hypothetical protein